MDRYKAGGVWQAHGEFSIYRPTSNLVWTVVRGAVNRECAEDYRDIVSAQARQLAGRPWLRVSDIRHWQLCGPEAIPPLHQLMHICEASQLAHSITIVSMHNLQTHLLDLMMAGIHRHSQRHLTASLDETCDLLASLLGNSLPRRWLARIYPDEYCPDTVASP